MALTGLEIFKRLPKTNCKDCGFPTCLAFAMKLAAGEASLDSCPHVSEATRAELAEASAPPIRLVKVGNGQSAFQVGEELVLFRHEKRFINETAIGLLIRASDPDQKISEKIDQLKKAVFERVGQVIRANFAAIRDEDGNGERLKEVAQRVEEETSLPQLLISPSVTAIEAALGTVGAGRPLIYCTSLNETEKVVELAKRYSCPMVVSTPGELSTLAETTEKIKAAGLNDIVLHPGPVDLKTAFKHMIFIRRAALEKKFRPLGYPTVVFTGDYASNSHEEAVIASAFLCKYASIIVLDSMEAWKIFPLLILRQNIFSDPQVPMQVEEKIYPIGDPKENSPVALTTNFSLTYFIVSGEIEASKVPTWLLVMNVDGQSVLTAWAAGKFVPDRIAAFVKKSGIAEKVTHRNLIIPGYVAQISGELEEELGEGWKVIVGCREAGDIPRFLQDYVSSGAAVR